MGETIHSSSTYCGRLLGDLRQLYTQGQLVDTTLTLAECGTLYYAHRCVLVGASPFFKSLLHQDKLTSNITIKSVSSESFSRLLDFLYSGELRLTSENVWQVLAASRQLQVPEATQVCQAYIDSKSVDDDDSPDYTSLDTASVKLEPGADWGGGELEAGVSGRRSRRGRIKQTPKVKLSASKSTYKPTKEPSKETARLKKTGKRKGKKHVDSPPELSEQEDPENDADYIPPPSGNFGDEDDDLDEPLAPAVTLTTTRKRRGRPRKGEESSPVRKKVKSEKASSKSPSKGKQGRPRKGEQAPKWVTPHRITAKDLPSLKCSVCEYKFYHQGALQLHMRKHRIIGAYKRHVLHKHSALQCLRVSTLLRHEVNIDGEAFISCVLCKKTFSKQSRGRAHFLKKHLQHPECTRCKRKPYHTFKVRLVGGCRRKVCAKSESCDLCHRQFRNMSVLQRHQSDTHKDAVLPPKLTCRHCTRSFTDRQLFITHLFGHGLTEQEVHLEFTDPTRVPVRLQIKQVEKDENNPLPYKCPNCEHRYKTLSDLNKHMINRHNLRVLPPTKKHPAKKIRCEEEGGSCGRVFPTKQQLRVHLANDHTGASYDCYLCKYSTPVKRDLRMHLQYRHTSREGKTCEECNKHFRKRYHYRIHLVSKHGVNDPNIKMYSCDAQGCDYKTYARYVLETHKKKHNKEKNFACNICGRKLKSEKAVEKHVSKVHMGIRPFICDICGASYGEEHELKMHIVRHNDVKQFQCEHCDYATHDKGNFQNHLHAAHKIAEGSLRNRIEICSICGYTVASRWRMKDHMAIHNQERSFSCSYCDKTFVTRRNMVGHIRWNHERKMIRCKYCSFEAPLQHHVTKHERYMHTHRNLKPYQCAYCDYRCNVSGNCRKHVRQRHPNLPIKWVKVADADNKGQKSLSGVQVDFQICSTNDGDISAECKSEKPMRKELLPSIKSDSDALRETDTDYVQSTVKLELFTCD